MARITVVADSLTTEEVRRGLVAHNQALRSEFTPKSMEATDCEGMAWVGCNGPEHWRFKSIALTPEQATSVAAAIAGPHVDADLERVCAPDGTEDRSMA